jgi:integrase
VTIAPPALTLADLWTKYVEIRQVGKSPSTLRMYDWVGGHIDRCPHKLPSEAQAIFDWLSVNIVPGTVKRLLTQFCACARWAKKAGFIDINPFIGMAAEIKQPTTEEDEDVNPFSRQERDHVIAAFKANSYYSRYVPLVEFLFFTGCRPSEALALEWRPVSSSAILFDQALVNGRGRKLVVKKGLKTPA